MLYSLLPLFSHDIKYTVKNMAFRFLKTMVKSNRQ